MTDSKKSIKSVEIFETQLNKAEKIDKVDKVKSQSINYSALIVEKLASIVEKLKSTTIYSNEVATFSRSLITNSRKRKRDDSESSSFTLISSTSKRLFKNFKKSRLNLKVVVVKAVKELRQSRHIYEKHSKACFSHIYRNVVQVQINDLIERGLRNEVSYQYRTLSLSSTSSISESEFIESILDTSDFCDLFDFIAKTSSFSSSFASTIKTEL